MKRDPVSNFWYKVSTNAQPRAEVASTDQNHFAIDKSHWAIEDFFTSVQDDFPDSGNLHRQNYTCYTRVDNGRACTVPVFNHLLVHTGMCGLYWNQVAGLDLSRIDRYATISSQEWPLASLLEGNMHYG